MADYDLIVRGGEIHDGTGGPGVIGDVAIKDGRIAAVGVVTGSADEVIDATGKIVTPGFVDIHTHYDGQATWEQRMAPSSSHGVTSVVMGNCGVGFAPCRPEQQKMLIEVMEGVEDIPEVVMAEGIPWNWETFPEYLDALSRRELDIDIAAQLPHSALRVYVMGERGARKEAPTTEDLRRMREIVAEAMKAGAMGVTTSRNLMHRSRAGELAPSLHSDEDELLALAGGLRDAGAGVYQLIPDIVADLRDEFALMRRIAEAAKRPLSFTLIQMATGDPEGWRHALRLLEESHTDAVEIRAQVFPRPVGMLYGLDLSFHPFVFHPSFQPLAELPLAEKVKALREPHLKAQLLSETATHTNPVSIKTAANFRFGYLMGDEPDYEPDPTQRIDNLAREAGVSPYAFIYDKLMEDDGRRIIFQPGANYRDGNLEAARTMAAHPRTVLGLGDGGAHYGMICDASFPTFYLQAWVRDEGRVDLATAIRALSAEPAGAVGLNDRGLLAAGYRADVNVIDLAKLKLHVPHMVRDLPAGGKRLRQTADGYVATIVKGQVTYRDGAPTGALPGRLVRGAQAAPVHA